MKVKTGGKKKGRRKGVWHCALEGHLHTAGHRLRRPTHHLSNSTSPSTLLCSNPPTAWPGMTLNSAFSSLFGDHIWLSSCAICVDCRLRCDFRWGLFCASTSFPAAAPAFWGVFGGLLIVEG